MREDTKNTTSKKAKEYAVIARALSYIHEHQKEQPSLESVSKHVGLSPFHFQRLFVSWAGVSPKKFLQYLSLKGAKEMLRQGEGTLFDATYKTGLSGTGRLHDLFVTVEGMTPGEYRQGGADVRIFYSIGQSAFGAYLIASTEKGVSNIIFFDEEEVGALEELRTFWPKARFVKQKVKMHQLVQEFFDGTRKSGERIALHLKGTPFQLKVWEALLMIPEGRLVSYSAIADKLRKSRAQRAVGTAIGSNPIAYLIPCHRVIKSIGTIGEYRWGTPRKMAMIGREAKGNGEK